MFDEAVAGAFAGMIGTLLGFPLDLVKTRMQTQQTSYRGVLPTLREIFIREGLVSGLYKGVAAPMTALTILNTMNFASYSYFRRILDVPDETFQEGNLFDVRIPIAGALGGPLLSVISTPFELLKTQMQLDNVSAKRYRGSLHAAQSILKVQLHATHQNRAMPSRRYLQNNIGYLQRW